MDRQDQGFIDGEVLKLTADFKITNLELAFYMHRDTSVFRETKVVA